MFSSNAAEKEKKEYDMEAPPFKKQIDEEEEVSAGISECGEEGIHPVDEIAQSSRMHVNLRNAFLRRVYGILSIQLLITTAICAFCALFEPVTTTMLAHSQAFMLGTFIPTIAVLIALGFMKTVHPWNAVLLLLFTVLESMSLGVVCAAYYTLGLADILVSAAALTLGVFLCLTAFVLISKRDFSFLGGFLFTMLFIMIGWGLLNIIMGWRVHFLYSAAGALLFCGFILFDTSRIAKTYSYDDYISASIELYLDIINLFLYILQLLSSDRN